MSTNLLELKRTIKLIRELNTEIEEIDNEIKRIMDKINSPILSIPGISCSLGAMIILKSVTSLISALLIKFLLLLDYLHQLISQASLIILMPIWKIVVLNISDTLFSMLLNLFATGINLFPIRLLRLAFNS